MIDGRRLRLVVLGVLLMASPAAAQVARLKGTSLNQFDVQANSATPLHLTNVSGGLLLGGGLTCNAGTINFSGATVADLGTVTTMDLNGGTIDGATINSSPIGGATRAAGAFTSLAANNGLSVTGGTISFSGVTVSNLGNVTTANIDGGTIDGVAIGGTTRGAGAFTSLAANNQITSTLADGTAPFVLSSATKVTNLNADWWDDVGLSSTRNPGGVLCFTASSAYTIYMSEAGTTGQFLRSAGTTVPTWQGLASAHIFVGTAGGIPADVAMSGDATISNTGAVTIANDAVTPAKCTGAIEQGILNVFVTVGAESANKRTITLQVRDASDVAMSNQYCAMHFLVWESSMASVPATVTVAITEGEMMFDRTPQLGGLAVTAYGTSRLTIDVTATGARTLSLTVELQGKVSVIQLTYAA